MKQFLTLTLGTFLLVGCVASETPTINDATVSSSEASSSAIAQQEDAVNQQGDKPVITDPANGSIVAGPSVTIKGVASPNYEVFAYINHLATEPLGFNSYANGGATEADANGNFSLNLAEPCSKKLSVIVAAMPEEESRQEVWDQSRLSEPISITITGELSDICNQ